VASVDHARETINKPSGLIEGPSKPIYRVPSESIKVESKIATAIIDAPTTEDIIGLGTFIIPLSYDFAFVFFELRTPDFISGSFLIADFFAGIVATVFDFCADSLAPSCLLRNLHGNRRSH
jgi:hypothetical protein